MKVNCGRKIDTTNKEELEKQVNHGVVGKRLTASTLFVNKSAKRGCEGASLQPEDAKIREAKRRRGIRNVGSRRFNFSTVKACHQKESRGELTDSKQTALKVETRKRQLFGRKDSKEKREKTKKQKSRGIPAENFIEKGPGPRGLFRQPKNDIPY